MRDNRFENKLRELFYDAGIADSRHYELEQALAECHRAFAPLDTHNRALVIEHMPFIAQCARFYGLNMNACNTFEHDEIEMPEEIDARVREMINNI
jgi:hypothetical protein